MKSKDGARAKRARSAKRDEVAVLKDIKRGIREADSGDFATSAEVRAVFAKRGGIWVALRRSPLVDADLKMKRTFSKSRKIKL